MPKRQLSLSSFRFAYPGVPFGDTIDGSFATPINSWSYRGQHSIVSRTIKPRRKSKKRENIINSRGFHDYVGTWLQGNIMKWFESISFFLRWMGKRSSMSMQITAIRLELVNSEAQISLQTTMLWALCHRNHHFWGAWNSWTDLQLGIAMQYVQPSTSWHSM